MWRGSWEPRSASRDWTPIVLLVCSLSLTLAALAWLLPRWLPGRGLAEPGDEIAEHGAPAHVVLWVRELEPQGVKLALSSVWGDARPDREHDLALRRRLGLPEGDASAWYRLLLFNPSASARRVAVGDIALVLEGEGGPARQLSLVSVLQQAGLSPAPALASLLRGLGALSEEVDLPPGAAVPLLVLFDRRVDLASATAVASRDGAAFQRRQMARGQFQRLLSEPDEALVRDL